MYSTKFDYFKYFILIILTNKAEDFYDCEMD